MDLFSAFLLFLKLVSAQAHQWVQALYCPQQLESYLKLQESLLGTCWRNEWICFVKQSWFEVKLFYPEVVHLQRLVLYLGICLQFQEYLLMVCLKNEWKRLVIQSWFVVLMQDLSQKFHSGGDNPEFISQKVKFFTFQQNFPLGLKNSGGICPPVPL